MPLTQFLAKYRLRCFAAWGCPSDFANVVIRLHEGAKIMVKFDDRGVEVHSSIGVRKGPCEGPVLFLFAIKILLVASPIPPHRVGGGQKMQWGILCGQYQS